MRKASLGRREQFRVPLRPGFSGHVVLQLLVEHRARIVTAVRSEKRDTLGDLRIVHLGVHADERSILDALERDTAVQGAIREVRMRAGHGPHSENGLQRGERRIRSHGAPV
jgi:hypothetical protein